MEFFLSVVGERSGPFSQFTVIERIRDGSFKGDELAWHKGADEWRPLRELEEFTSYWPLTTEQIARADEARRIARVPLDTPQPWNRFWARMLDYIWFNVVLGMIAGTLLPNPAQIINWSTHAGLEGMLLGSLTLLAFVPVEAWCLSRYGTTPGKALLRIQVQKLEGGLPAYPQAMKRSFLVFLRGIALGLTLPALFTMSFSRMRLLQTGTTVWDRNCLTRVEHGEPEVWRSLLVAGVILGFIFLTMAALMLSPEFMEAVRSGLPK